MEERKRFGLSRARDLLGAVALISVLLAPARAQWTAVNLHPAGASSSRAYGVGGGLQAGYAIVGGEYHAGTWSGSAESWLDLNPAGSYRSRVNGLGGGQQAGYAYIPTYSHAGFWSGSTDSWVDLNPTGVVVSLATATDGVQQVGDIVAVDSNWHASLWSGSAASWVDLNPPLSTWSEVNGVHGGQQVGRARLTGVTRAVFWLGTADSWVNLHPPVATNSFALAVHDGWQAGYANVGGGHKASLWNGSADSWIDLNPAGSAQSEARGVFDGHQAGFATASGWGACIWAGTPESWLDLHQFLPPGYSYSEAFGIWHDGGATYVVGFAWNIANAREEAMLWVGPPPAAGVPFAEDAAAGIHLLPAAPNPSRGAAHLRYFLPAEGRLRVELFDVNGRLLETLFDARRPAGSGDVTWNGEAHPAGVYFFRTSTAGARATQRFVLVR